MKKVKVGKSKIHGNGLFADEPIKRGDVIELVHTLRELEPGVIKTTPTLTGRNYNHSDEPNSLNVIDGNNRYLVALKEIDAGGEITTNYRTNPELEQPDSFDSNDNYISFDYDDTLTTPEGFKLAQQMNKEGKNLYVITARDKVTPQMIERAEAAGIPKENIIPAGSDQEKVRIIKENNINKHIDNKDAVIKALGDKGELFAPDKYSDFKADFIEMNLSDDDLNKLKEGGFIIEQSEDIDTYSGGGTTRAPNWSLAYNPYAYNAGNVVGGYERYGDLTSQNLQLSTPDIFGREKNLNATKFPLSISAGRMYDKNLTNDYGVYGKTTNYDGYGNYTYKTPQELLDSKTTPFAEGIPLDAEISFGVEGSGINPNMKKRSKLGAQFEVGYNPTTGVYEQLNTKQKWALGNNYTNPLNKKGEWRVEPYVTPLNFQFAQKPTDADQNKSYDQYLQGLVDSGSSYDPLDPKNPLHKDMMSQVEGKNFVSTGAGIDAQVKLPLGMIDAGIGASYNLQKGQGQKFSPTAHLGYKIALDELGDKINLPQINLPERSPFRSMSVANDTGRTYDDGSSEELQPQGSVGKANASPIHKRWQPEAEDIFIDWKNQPTQAPFTYDPVTGESQPTEETDNYAKGGVTSQEEIDAANIAMMKARLAYAYMHGNPAAQRMVVAPDQPYMFDNGMSGTHYMASMDNYAVPQIQDVNGQLMLGDYGPNSMEAIRFDNPEDAEYFAEHYKEITPDASYREEYKRGGEKDGDEPKRKKTQFQPGTYDPNETAGYMLDEQEVFVPVKATNWGKAAIAYEKRNSEEDFVDKKKKQYLKKNKGLNELYGVNMENFPQEVEQNFRNEYDYNKNTAVVKKVGKQEGWNPNRRTQYVDDLNDTQRGIVAESKYGSKLQPTYWDRTLAGLATLASKFSPELRDAMNKGYMPGLTKKESQEILNAKMKKIPFTNIDMPFEIPIGGLESLAFTEIPGAFPANYMKSRGLTTGSDYKELPSWYNGEKMANVTDADVTASNLLTYAGLEAIPELGVNAARSLYKGVKSGYKTVKELNDASKAVNVSKLFSEGNNYAKNLQEAEQFAKNAQQLDGSTLFYKTRGKVGKNTSTGLAEADIEKAIDKNKDWITSSEYARRRAANTGESPEQIQKSVDNIINAADNATYRLNASARKMDFYGADGMMSKKKWWRPAKVEISPTADNPLQTLEHEVKHLYSPAIFDNRKVYENYPAIDAEDYYLTRGPEQQVRHLNAREQILEKYNLPMDAQLSEEQVADFIDEWRSRMNKRKKNPDDTSLHQDYDGLWSEQVALIQKEMLKAKYNTEDLGFIEKLPTVQKIKFMNAYLDRLNKTIRSALNNAWMTVPVAGGMEMINSGTPEQRYGGSIGKLKKFIR